MTELRDLIAHKLLKSGLSQHHFAGLRGASERTLQKHLAGWPVGEPASKWYRRFHSVSIEGDFVVIRLARLQERRRTTENHQTVGQKKAHK